MPVAPHPNPQGHIISGTPGSPGFFQTCLHMERRSLREDSGKIPERFRKDSGSLYARGPSILKSAHLEILDKSLPLTRSRSGLRLTVFLRSKYVEASNCVGRSACLGCDARTGNLVTLCRPLRRSTSIRVSFRRVATRIKEKRRVEKIVENQRVLEAAA